MKSKERQFCTHHDGAVIEHHATGHMVNKLLDEGLLKFRQVSECAQVNTSGKNKWGRSGYMIYFTVAFYATRVDPAHRQEPFR